MFFRMPVMNMSLFGENEPSSESSYYCVGIVSDEGASRTSCEQDEMSVVCEQPCEMPPLLERSAKEIKH